MLESQNNRFYPHFEALLKIAAFVNVAFGLALTGLAVYNNIRPEWHWLILPDIHFYFAVVILLGAFGHSTKIILQYVLFNAVLSVIELSLIILCAMALIFSNDDNLRSLVNAIDFVYPGAAQLGGTWTVAICFIAVQLAISTTRIFLEAIACHALVVFKKKHEEEESLLTEAERRLSKTTQRNPERARLDKESLYWTSFDSDLKPLPI